MKHYIETRIIERAIACLDSNSYVKYTPEPPSEIVEELGVNYIGFKHEVLKIALFPKDKTERFFSWYLCLFKSNLLKKYYQDVRDTNEALHDMFNYADPMFVNKVQDFLSDLKSRMALSTFSHYGVSYYNLDIASYFFDKYRLGGKRGWEHVNTSYYKVEIRNLYRNSTYGKEIQNLTRKLSKIEKLIDDKNFSTVVRDLTNEGTNFRKEIRKIEPILRLYVEIVDHVHSLYKNRKF